MNSSPPPPSFTLPPLNSSGQFPVTPPGSHSPSPSAEGSKNRAGKNVNHGDASEDGGRVSMYVKLFEGEYTHKYWSDTDVLSRNDRDSTS
jgi:Fanconi-associated nuclease 1